MAMMCALCGKKSKMGLQHKHHPGVAGGRWKKRAPKTAKKFKPNLHASKILVSGGFKRVKLCTKCQRISKANIQAWREIQAMKKASPVAPMSV